MITRPLEFYHQSFTVCPMKFAFDQISPEIVVEILSWLGPYDLLTVKLVSSRFLYLIQRNAICWIKARQNVGNMPPPPSGLSESAYASYLPEKMYTISLSPRSLRALPYLKKYLPFASWLPYETMTDDSVVYLQRHAEILHARFTVMQNERGLTAAEEEYCKESPLRQADVAAQMKHSAALYKWSFGYLTKCKHVTQANQTMIENFACQEGIKLTRLNASAKIQQTLETFGKSLTLITCTVIRDICWAAMKDLSPCPELPQNHRGRIRCPKCSKVFLPGALLDHLRIK
ncbi:hypothetical protein ARMGADRAFT_1091312 [Armillaria gallica]|uniref:F-box domain-containing protein n=1 Tax=Armillaria gallica TaxID=47427 RepID=A0A2H3CHT2_ARMGA|nr:hypothetical protein ARMGADRAFT_1091312 [Armillaria gallica]